MKRIGSLIRLRPEKYGEYKSLHAAVWPEILDKITCRGIRNYSNYHKDGFFPILNLLAATLTTAWHDGR